MRFPTAGDRERETDRQTDRQRQTEAETEKQRDRERQRQGETDPKVPDLSAVHYHNVRTTRSWNSGVQLVQETRAKRRLAHTA